MLREVLIVEQNNPSLRRRWFESDYFDLFIWQDSGGAFVRFQLCYDVELNERALVWSDPEGFYHDGVDHGDGGPEGGRGQGPILVRDGKFDSGTVGPRFERKAAQIPHRTALGRRGQAANAELHRTAPLSQRSGSEFVRSRLRDLRDAERGEIERRARLSRSQRGAPRGRLLRR